MSPPDTVFSAPCGRGLSAARGFPTVRANVRPVAVRAQRTAALNAPAPQEAGGRHANSPGIFMLQVRDVVKSYDGRVVVNKVAFEVRPATG